MTAYVLTPLAKADIFNIWAHIAENSEPVAARVEQAIYDACAFLAEGPLRGHTRPDLTARPLRFWTVIRYPKLHSCLPARDGPASNRCRPPRQTQYSPHSKAAHLSLRGEPRSLRRRPSEARQSKVTHLAGVSARLIPLDKEGIGILREARGE